MAIAVTSNPYEDEVELRVLLYLKVRRFDLLFKWADAMSSQLYDSPDTHFRMHQLFALIKKYPLDPALTGFDPQETALTKFRQAEHRCKRFNQRFRAIRSTGRDVLGAVTHTARQWIQYVLGRTPDHAEVYAACDFTGGSSIGVHGNATNVAQKLKAPSWTVSAGALKLLAPAIWSNAQFREYTLRLTQEDQSRVVSLDPGEFSRNLANQVRVVCYNKVAFVPKTAKTYRSIAVEPLLNTYLQKGVDQVMRRRLKRVGLDLGDQSPNQEMARLGSYDPPDGYCTIDLSSASDTMALEVVKELLPMDWYDLLYSLRSPGYKLSKKTSLVNQSSGDQVFVYEKFVSMGNGFCFPLQTLIFASLAAAISKIAGVPLDMRVYGDDIIVRKGIFPKMLEALSHFGFVPNPEKTFGSGPFRESCGTDWLSGDNVRPIYLKNELNTLARIFGFHNETKRHGSRVRMYFADIRRYLRNEAVPYVAKLCVPFDPLPEAAALRKKAEPWVGNGPLLDSAFWVRFDEFMSSAYTRWSYSEQRWEGLALRQIPAPDKDWQSGKSVRDNIAYLIGALRGCESAEIVTGHEVIGADGLVSTEYIRRNKYPFALRYQVRTNLAYI